MVLKKLELYFNKEAVKLSTLECNKNERRLCKSQISATENIPGNIPENIPENIGIDWGKLG
jgi:hypothetical protein